MTHPASQLDLEFLDELLDGDKEFAEELLPRACGGGRGLHSVPVGTGAIS